MDIVFATNNRHKLEEIAAHLEGAYRIIGLEELGIREEIPEDHDTLEENALQKASFIFDRTGQNCFADDTGLEVEALNGAPGVFSARYAQMGDPVFPDMEPAAGNIKKLLLAMEGEENRRAKFRTVISLILDGKSYQFEGVVQGEITRSVSGSGGFGYDPVFRPEAYDVTFAEMGLDVKNKISHRARAVNQLVEFLRRM